MDMTQEELFTHPAGPAQFDGFWTTINRNKRVVAKYILDSQFGFYLCSGLYAPPGELITIEIPEKAIGKLYIVYNPHTQTMKSQHWAAGQQVKRFPQLTFGSSTNTMLDRKVCKHGNPFGGLIVFGSIEKKKANVIE